MGWPDGLKDYLHQGGKPLHSPAGTANRSVGPEGGSAQNRSILSVVGLRKHFGGIQALNEVTFHLEEMNIVSLIGPNGAGKTTLINLVTGVFPPDEGEIYFQGDDIAGLPAHVIASRGIGRTFQLEELFTSLTVLENVMVGCHTKSHLGILACGFRLSSARGEERKIRDEAIESLRLVGLEEKASHPIHTLPLGERKLVGIARALAMNPRFLLLDEPAGGLAAHEIEKLVNLFYRLVEGGLTFLIVEHNMPFVMSLSRRVIVLDAGTKIAEGSPEEVKANDSVIQAYLGEEV